MECPYHHSRWRGELQRLLNLLRENVLTAKHIRQFSTAVCTCKGRCLLTCPLSGGSELHEWVYGNDDKRLEECKPGLVKFIEAAVNDLSNYSEEVRAGFMRVVQIIKDATECKFDQLEVVTKTTDKQCSVMKEEVQLPLSSEHLGVFLGSGGKHIKLLCKQYKVELHLGEPPSGSTRVKWISCTDSMKGKILYEPENSDGVEAFKQQLMKRAKQITLKRKQHKVHVVDHYKRRASLYRPVQTSSSNQLADFLENHKEIATETFTKKHQNDKFRPEVKTSNSVLNEGHCLNCLAPFSRLNEKAEGECTHHSGFLVSVKAGKPNQGYLWSCCRKRTAAKHPSHQLHKQTGCTVGLHVWRPGKSASKHSKTSVRAEENDFTLN